MKLKDFEQVAQGRTLNDLWLLCSDEVHAPDALPWKSSPAHPNRTFCMMSPSSSSFAYEFQGLFCLFVYSSHSSVLLQSLTLYSLPLEHHLQVVLISFSPLLPFSANY